MEKSMSSLMARSSGLYNPSSLGAVSIAVPFSGWLPDCTILAMCMLPAHPLRWETSVV